MVGWSPVRPFSFLPIGSCRSAGWSIGRSRLERRLRRGRARGRTDRRTTTENVPEAARLTADGRAIARRHRRSPPSHLAPLPSCLPLWPACSLPAIQVHPSSQPLPFHAWRRRWLRQNMALLRVAAAAACERNTDSVPTLRRTNQVSRSERAQVKTLEAPVRARPRPPSCFVL